MKIDQLLLLCLLMIKNIIDQTVSVKIKQQKGFDEIFGEEWQETTHTNEGDQSDQNGTIGQRQNGDKNRTKNGKKSDSKILARQFDQKFDENLEVKEETPSECDQMEQMSEDSGQISDHFSNEIEKKKREIVEKFHKIKEKLKQERRKKYSRKEWNKIERKIAQKLDVSQKKIYKWKREFGMNIINKYSDEEKDKILMRFDQLYDKINEKLNEKLVGKRKKCQKIIAKQLGIDIRTIYYWKKQLKNGNFKKNQKIDEQKKEIVEKYFKIKNEFMQMAKHSLKEWEEFYLKIKKMFGVNYRTIERWAKKIGIIQSFSKVQKMNTFAKKMEKMKQYDQMKKQNPKLYDWQIAEILKISTASLTRFKIEFKEENGEMF